MLSISILMLLAFSVIYFITAQGMEQENFSRLMSYQPKIAVARNIEKNNPDEIRRPPNFSLAFSVETDMDFQVVKVNSFFDFEENFYKNIVKEVFTKGVKSSKLNNNGILWQYNIMKAKNHYMVVFLDISNSQKMLNSLIYTFIFVGCFTLLVIFFISLFFANRSIQPIKTAWENQKEFIADASHELKTPLTIIHTNADVLLSNPNETIESQKKWIHYIKSETERMGKLTNDLLYLAKVDYSDSKMIFASFNLSDCINGVILTMEAVIYEKSLILETDIAEEILINGNREQIMEVLMILLDNAIKYTNNQGVIKMSLAKAGHKAIFKITNTGEGIEPEHMENIFNRFYRTDKSRARQSGGYGLGLSIAKSIVEQHRGKIYAKSVIGEETSFFVELMVL